VNNQELDQRQEAEQPNPASLYCMASMVADEASRNGFGDFARALEAALDDFLTGMSRDQQSIALRLSYEAALRGLDPAPPRLRLVYSRD
jgi:hypothetical protein